MKEKFTLWDAADHIKTEEDMRYYLEACSDEDPGDGSLIRAALRDIARSQNMSALARAIDMDRASLYKALSADGNPSLATILKVSQALGLRLRLEPVPGKDGQGSANTEVLLQEQSNH